MNVSKQLATTANEDAVSMYLSFDESMSNISYKSTAASTTIDTSENTGKDDSILNKTLEPQKDDDFMDTMKDALETSELSSAFGRRLQPVHTVLCEFKVLSSTPSKGDGKNIDRINLSGNGACLNIKRNSNISGVLKNLTTKLEKSLSREKDEEDKENKQNKSDDSLPSFSRTSILEIQTAKNKSTTVQIEKQKPQTDNIVGNSIEKPTKKNIPAVKKKVKMHTVVRKSLCEPDLQTNRPSRIVPNKSRYSYMNNGETVNVGGTMWPISNSNRFYRSEDENHLGLVNESDTPTEETIDIIGDKILIKPFRKSLKPKKAANIARKSVLPSVSSDIRIVPQRMSTLVKTTLNSSTRKAPRKSIAGASNTALSQRRSVLLLQNKLASPLLSRKKVSYRTNHSSSSSDNCNPTVRAAGGGDIGKRSPKSHSTAAATAAARRTIQFERPEVKYSCSECGAFYNVRSLLDAHKRMHHVISPETLQMRSQNVGSTSANYGIGTTNTTNNNRCKYCDKGFAIERALHIHLLEHCSKIPAAERRKLNYKEMDHVIKAETPHFRLAATRSNKKTASTPIDGGKDPLVNFPVKKFQDKSENDFELQNTKKTDDIVKTDEKITSTIAQTVKSQMGPPTSSKIKKKTAHVGVYRTPNKEIPCVTCKQSFKNIMDYTNHMMKAHKSLNINNGSADSRND